MGCASSLLNQFSWDPEVLHGNLSNGITYALRAEKGPVIISVLVAAGSLHEERAGSLWALRSIWENDDGPLLRSSGIEWQILPEYHYTRISMSFPPDNDALPETALQILNRWLFDTKVPESPYLRQALLPDHAGTPSRFTRSFTPLVLFHSKHARHSPYGTTVDENLSTKDVKDFYRQNFQRANTYLAVSGQIQIDTVKDQLQAEFSSSMNFENQVILPKIPLQQTSHYQVVPPDEQDLAVIYVKFPFAQLAPSVDTFAIRLRFQLFTRMLEKYLLMPEIADQWEDSTVHLTYLGSSLALLTISLSPHDSVFSAVERFDATMQDLMKNGFSLAAFAEKKHEVARQPRDMVMQLSQGYPITTQKTLYHIALQALSKLSEPELRELVPQTIAEGRSVLLITDEELHEEMQEILGEEVSVTDG